MIRRTDSGARAARTALWLLAVAALATARLVPAGAADEKEITLKTRIQSATIYSDQAQVTRGDRVDLKAGIWKLVCDDLPQGFSESSLQVEGRGTAQARIMGVDIVRIKGRAAESPRYKELKDKLDKLTGTRDTLQIELASVRSSAEYLDSYARFPFEKAQSKLAPEIFRVQDWKNVIEFIQAERVKTNEKIDALGKREKKLVEEITWLGNQLNEMQVKGDWTKRVVIDCEVRTPGYLDLSLMYNVSGATWSPEYLIRFDTAKETINFTYNARLQQYTGEDWTGIAASLSTARPQLGAAPPEIAPLYLSQPALPRLKDELHVRGGRTAAVQMQIDGVVSAVAQKAGVAAPAEAEEFDMERSGVDAFSNEFAATFSIPKAVDLASGADPRRVMILQETLSGKLSRYTAPRLAPNVYIKGDVTNTLEAPLLAGTADVYIETAAGGQGTMSNFVGKETIKPVMTGQEFAVHLGIDQNVKVAHKLEKKEYLTKEGAAVKKIRYSYLITLESFKTEAVEIKLQDRIPVSTLKDVKVTNVDLEPKPAEEREDGILTWNVATAPKEKKEIRVAFTIEFPGDWPEYFLRLE